MPELGQLPEIHSLWIGARLTWIERLSLCSWVEHGHQIRLWCYEPIEGVPAGVRLVDAEAILPQTSIIRDRKRGSVALFSDRFRYHLLRRQAATWLDIDMVLLRPLADTRPCLFGWETPTSISTAVMRLPPESTVLHNLIDLTDARVPVPGWWTPRKKRRQRLKGLIGLHERGQDMKWGSFGPRALTHFLQQQGLAYHALPIEAFYPVHWRDSSLFFATPDAVSAQLTSKTCGVHLWSSSSIRQRRNEPPPSNSWLAAMCKRYAVDAAR